MPDMDYFIDSHCHMFTMADIPLYKSIEQALADNDKLETFTLLSLLIFARPFVDPKKKLEHYKPYITFFESESEENVQRLSQEVTDAVTAGGAAQAGVTGKQVVITPLIMDFDAGADVRKLRSQAVRLRSAVKDARFAGLKVLPFLGIHPGRSSDDIAALLKDFAVRSVKNRGGIDKTDHGDFIGIKLYPPLGFDVYPDDRPAVKEAYLAVYKEFSNRGLPITVHCQKSSFSLTSSLEEYTMPQNWVLVMEKIPELRINFAHFGGEEGMRSAITFEKKDGNTLNFFDQSYKAYSEQGWTASIIKMLKTYPNTYADLSAFDVSDEQAVASLHWLIHLDEQGAFNKGGMPYMLEDKLLWGSDYPMVLNKDLGNYGTILSKFKDAFHFDGRRIGSFEYPPKRGSGAQETFLKKICCDNPKKFLFG